MSGMQIMTRLLGDDEALMGLLADVDSVHVVKAPLGAKLPHLVVEQFRRSERRTTARNEITLDVTYVMHVTAVAEKYSDVGAILKAARKAAGSVLNKEVDGIPNVCTKAGDEGQDSGDDENSVYGRAQEFVVNCKEPGYA